MEWNVLGTVALLDGFRVARLFVYIRASSCIPLPPVIGIFGLSHLLPFPFRFPPPRC